MVPDSLRAFAELAEKRLETLLPAEGLRPQRLHAAMRYAALAPGKRIRPGLCMAAAGACGANPESVVDAACALELVHCFSLIHDDLPAIDDDDLRRGRPTLHRRFDEATAILAGDALFALAFETLAASPHPPGRIARALVSLAKASGTDGLVGGEMIDIESEGQPIDRDTLHYIHTRKTGSLIAASTEIGALLAGAPPSQTDALRTYGEKVGLAFQIADDVLNETSTADQLGKAVGSDRERQKATYPALYGVDASRDQARALAAEASQIASTFGASGQPLRELAQFCVERLL